MTTLADQYRDAAARVVAAEAERDALVVAAHATGTSVRAIGRELGVTHEMVRKILARAARRSSACRHCGDPCSWHNVRQAWTHEGRSWWCDETAQGYDQPHAEPVGQSSARS